MIDIGSKVKDKDNKIGVLVGYVSGTKPVVLFNDYTQIYESTQLLEEVTEC